MTSTARTAYYPRVPLHRRIVGDRLRRAPFLGLLFTWHERLYQRQRLAELDTRLLRDIGISPEEAAAEYRKPFWRA